MEKSGRRFEGTRTLGEFYAEAASFSWQELFERFPIKEIRLKCLEAGQKVVFAGVPATLKDAAWAEECIIDLLQQIDSIWENVMSWYISACGGSKSLTRAIEFCLSLRKEIAKIEAFYPCRTEFILSGLNTISKSVVGGLLKDGGTASYPLISSLRGYLVSQLFLLGKESGISEYSERDWIFAERALKIIVAAKDRSFIPVIRDIVERHESGWTQLGSKEPGLEYSRGVKWGSLHAALRILKRAKK